MLSASVVIATYNGEKFLRDQLDSIIPQLRDCDEVVISDDGSTDGTLDIINEYVKKYSIINYYEGPRRGVIKNFEFGIAKASKDIIFLSDQDDIWLPDKVSIVLGLFSENADITCVLHDVQIVDKQLNVIDPSFFEFRNSAKGLVRNLIKNSFMGSAMAFQMRMVPRLLPIPENVPMHDQWIGLINEIYGKVSICNQCLGLYRRHGNNASSFTHEPLQKMIKNRISLIQDLIIRTRSK